MRISFEVNLKKVLVTGVVTVAVAVIAALSLAVWRGYSKGYAAGQAASDWVDVSADSPIYISIPAGSQLTDDGKAICTPKGHCTPIPAKYDPLQDALDHAK